MLDITETAARRIWAASPYRSDGGNRSVSRYVIAASSQLAVLALSSRKVTHAIRCEGTTEGN
jgi:hypothetical protein